MVSIFLLTLLTAFVTDAFGYWVHRAIHRRWMGSLYRSHMAHHEVLYPPSDFFSKEYRSAGKDDTTRTFLLLGSPILLAPILAAVLGALSWFVAVWLFLVVACIGLLNSYIHDWIHLEEHWFHRIPGSKRLIELHIVHHVGMSKNYGIFTFFWDRLVATYMGS